MKFQRYLYNLSLGGLSVAMYIGNDDGVSLIVEDGGESVAGYDQKEFDSYDAYLKWVDEIVDGRDEASNDAQIVKDVINALKSK